MRGRSSRWAFVGGQEKRIVSIHSDHQLFLPTLTQLDSILKSRPHSKPETDSDYFGDLTPPAITSKCQVLTVLAAGFPTRARDSGLAHSFAPVAQERWRALLSLDCHRHVPRHPVGDQPRGCGMRSTIVVGFFLGRLLGCLGAFLEKCLVGETRLCPEGPPTQGPPCDCTAPDPTANLARSLLNQGPISEKAHHPRTKAGRAPRPWNWTWRCAPCLRLGKKGGSIQ